MRCRYLYTTYMINWINCRASTFFCLLASTLQVASSLPRNNCLSRERVALHNAKYTAVTKALLRKRARTLGTRARRCSCHKQQCPKNHAATIARRGAQHVDTSSFDPRNHTSSVKREPCPTP